MFKLTQQYRTESSL